MKVLMSLLFLVFLVACKSTSKVASNAPVLENTLLWKISGNGLTKPSYLYGTMHILCANEVMVSSELKQVMSDIDKLYFELDMSDMSGMMKAMPKMMMRGDTTLKTLLSKEDYVLAKAAIERSSKLPLSIAERMQPALASSLFASEYMGCDSDISGVEMKMMEINNKKKPIAGLETIEDQLNAFGAISYAEQAKMFMQSLKDTAKGRQMIIEMRNLYIAQNLNGLDKLMKADEEGLMNYEDDLLFKRNNNWLVSLNNLMPKNALLAAVGAAHLIGPNGMISLLRKAGYRVTPIMQSK